MAKSRARFLSELLGTTGLVKKSKSALAGADEVIDLSTLPSIPNSKLTNSSISIAGHSTALGASVTLDTADIGEDTNLYYTNARADARIVNAGSANWNTAYGWGDHASGGYAPLASPTLTGTPAAPTASGSTSTTQLATTAFVQQELTTLIGGAPGTLDTLNELAAAINDDSNYNSTLTTALATKLPLAGGTMSGNLIIASASSPTLDLPNAGNWSYIKNNTASGGLRFGTKNAGGTYSDQIEISATGNYVKLNRNTTVSGTINSGAITSTTGTTDSSPNILRVLSATEANTGKGDVYSGIEFGVVGAENSSGNLTNGVNAAIKSIDTRSGETSFEDAGLGFYTTDSAGGPTLRMSITDDGGVHVSNDGDIDTVSAGQIKADGNIYGNQLYSGGVRIANTAGQLTATTIIADDVDFLVLDNTDATTNIIWRDHSAQKLYLGTPYAEVEFRSNVNFQSGNVLKHNGTTILDTSRNLTNIGTIGSGAITATGLGTNSAKFTNTSGNGGYVNISSNVGGVSTDGDVGLHIGWNKSNGGREVNMIFDGGTSQADTEMIFTSTDGSTYTDIFQINGGGNVDIKSGGLRIGTTTVIDSARRFYVTNVQNSGVISFLNGTNGTSGSAAQGINVRHVYAGTTYANSTAGAGQIEASSGFKVAGTTVIDASRNLTNIGTINSGAITSSGDLKLTASGAKIIVDAYSGSSQEGGGIFFREGFHSSNQYNLSIMARSRSNDGSPDGLSINGYEGVFFSTGSNSYQERFGIDVSGNISVGGTNIISQSRNLTNIGTISSGAITTSGNVSVGGSALVENAKLKAIAESNTQTAIDVFVYDTRKDSDGGAWRKRTQHTSWYSEASDTRRGTRKDFPCVAVIVAHAAGVTIYDGDDPDMPMWMYIYAGYSHNFSIGFSQNGAPTAVTARDGVIYTTTNGGSQDNSVNGLFAHNFISDRMYQWNISGGFGYFPLPIEGRDSGGSLAYHETKVSYDATKKLVSAYLNDVAVTVLPNAPIDADTGLPVPTIAVATTGGVSVIKDNGAVVDITASAGSSYDSVAFISFDKNHNMIFEQDSTGRSLMYMPIPLADDTSVTDSNNSTDKRMFYASGTSNTLPKFNGTNATIGIGGSGEDQYIYGGTGVTHYAHGSSDATSSVAYTTSDYNTGWMNGDIKLAALSDTSTTNAVSTDLLGGIGNFTDANAWTVPSGWSLSSNIATGSAVTAYLVPASNGILTAGKKYAVTVTQSSYTSGSLYLYMGTGAPGSGNHYDSVPSTGGTFTFILNAYNSNFGIYGANYTGVIDNVTVSLAEPDRSAHKSGLQVFGTVTKTAVATGAELVGYSGFSTSNYLKQPYNSDLDFGTGDFSYSFWHSCSFNTPDRIWMSHGQYNVDGSGLSILQHNSSGPGNRIWIYVGTSSNSSHGYISVDKVEELGFQQWVITRRSGVLYVYRNGKLEGSVANTASVDLSSKTINELYLGVGREASAPFAYGAGPLALFRVSATAPTAEQIKKMYNDEKHLFATNAKATLYGSSDAVTALAYDDDTELLHVGTSAGRSEFQGLNRVNNTTDAVGTAISASNGLIVEE